jgi:transcription initiation factor TFIID subunit TAF12
MSLKIQEPQAAVMAASPVDAVSLSERVQARQPQPSAQQAAERAPEPRISHGNERLSPPK